MRRDSAKELEVYKKGILWLCSIERQQEFSKGRAVCAN